MIEKIPRYYWSFMCLRKIMFIINYIFISGTVNIYKSPWHHHQWAVQNLFVVHGKALQRWVTMDPNHEGLCVKTTLQQFSKNTLIIPVLIFLPGEHMYENNSSTFFKKHTDQPCLIFLLGKHMFFSPVHPTRCYEVWGEQIRRTIHGNVAHQIIYKQFVVW